MQRMTLQEYHEGILRDLAPEELRLLTLRLNTILLNPLGNKIMLNMPRGGEVSVDILSILYCRACRDYVHVFVNGRDESHPYSIRSTLDRMAQFLHHYGFEKCGRSLILNLAAVKENYPAEHCVVMINGVKLYVPERFTLHLPQITTQLALFTHSSR